MSARRVAAAEKLLATISWPTAEQEIWRYSRIGELDLARYRPFAEEELGRPGDERAPGGGPWAAEAGHHAGMIAATGRRYASSIPPESKE